MKKLLLVVLFAVLAVAASAQAVEQSVTFMPLIQSSYFLDRVEFNVVKWIDAPAGAGVGPMLEAAATPCHAGRIAFSRRFLDNPGIYRVIIAKHIVTQTVILSAGALTGSQASSNLDSPATDAALYAAVSASWSAFSGCDVNGAAQ